MAPSGWNSRISWLNSGRCEFFAFVSLSSCSYVCRLFDEKKWQKQQIKSEWKGETAGGCMNFDTCDNNPQYAILVSRPTNVFISLAQKEQRGTGQKLFHIGFKLVNKNGKRLKKLYSGEELGSSGPFVNRREVTGEISLGPSKTPYTLFVSAFKPGWETPFTVTIWSDAWAPFFSFAVSAFFAALWNSKSTQRVFQPNDENKT